MTEPLKVRLQVITEPYQLLKLECDGLTRVLSYVLKQNDIKHHIIYGSITDTQRGETMSPHFWILVPHKPEAFIVDYRARMWLGKRRKSIPNGVFMYGEYPSIKYKGTLVQNFRQLDDTLFRILTNGMEVVKL